MGITLAFRHWLGKKHFEWCYIKEKVFEHLKQVSFWEKYRVYCQAQGSCCCQIVIARYVPTYQNMSYEYALLWLGSGTISVCNKFRVVIFVTNVLLKEVSKSFRCVGSENYFIHVVICLIIRFTLKFGIKVNYNAKSVRRKNLYIAWKHIYVRKPKVDNKGYWPHILPALLNVVSCANH